MSTLRDQGYEALQRADLPNAIQLLESAIQSDPNDYYALLYLGAAYGQSGRHQDAVRVLTQSVQVQPSNAQARFNLGVALERAGWPQEAMTALQQALTLQPDYPKAQEALQRLQGGPAPTVPPPPAAPTATPAPSAAPAEHATVFLSPNLLDNLQPSQPDPGTAEPTQPVQTPPAGYGQQPPAASGQQPASYVQPQPMYGQPAANETPQGLAGGYGASQTPPGYGQPPPTMYGQPQPAGYGATAPPPAGAYGSYPQPTYYEDKFDLGQAFRDWIQVLRAPTTFFTDQVYRTGLKAPLAMMFLMALFSAGISLLFGLFHPSQLAGTIGLVIATLTIVFALDVGFTLLGARLLHWIGKMFGNSGEFSGTFRAVAYSRAPAPFFAVIGSIASLVLMPSTIPSSLTTSAPAPESAQVRVMPAQFEDNSQRSDPFASSRRSRGTASNPFGSGTTPRSNPFDNPAMGQLMALGGVGMLIGLLQLAWSGSLLVIGISQVQRTSIGSAIGTVLVTFIICVVLGVILAITMGAALFAMFAAAR